MEFIEGPSRKQPLKEESDLVRDALYALQGLPSAGKKLERLAKCYEGIPADDSSQSLTSLWAHSVTATALGKLLSVLARAGELRRELDSFVSFFLDGDTDDWDQFERGQRRARNAKQRSNKNKISGTDGKRDEEAVNDSASVNCASKCADISSLCLVNQAFAAAVRAVLRGHSAALNTLASSVGFRRLQDPSDHRLISEHLRDYDPGAVIGYGCRDITLLEFYLHTRDLRIQLQALAYICLRRIGTKFVGRAVAEKNVDLMSQGTVTEKSRESKNMSSCKSERAKRENGDAAKFNDFPRGANLLTYLYLQLIEVDPIHQKLLRFLFERAYQPYSSFIRSWLYQATIEDPYREFVIEQGRFRRGSSCITAKSKSDFTAFSCEMKLREGVTVPSFVEGVRAPLIRAGQQLQVLLRLAETSQLAQQMGRDANTIDLFERTDLRSDSWPFHKKNPVDVPALVFGKAQLEEVERKREEKSKLLNEQFDLLFKELYARRSEEDTDVNENLAEDPLIISDLIEAEKDRPVEREEREEPSSPWGSSTPESEVHATVRTQEDKRSTLSDENQPTAASDSVPETGRGTSVLDLTASKLEEVSFPPLNCRPLLYLEENVSKGGLTSRGGADGQGDEKHNHTAKADDVRFAFHALELPSSDFGKGSKAEDHSLQTQSFIADNQRGTSWPIWGLPVNPFLCRTNIDEHSPHFYAYTSFAGTFHPWDVTTKLSRANLSSLQTSALRESAKKSADVSVEPPWFTALASIFRDRLYAALDAHLDLPPSEYPDYGFDDKFRNLATLSNLCQFQHPPSADHLSMSYGSHVLSVASVKPLTFSETNICSGQGMLDGAETDVGSPAVVEFEPSLDPEAVYQVTDLIQNDEVNEFTQDSFDQEISVEDAVVLELSGDEGVTRTMENSSMVVLACDMDALSQSTDDPETAERTTEREGDAHVYEGSNWVQYLRSSESLLDDKVRAWSDGAIDEDGEEIPLSVVVNKCIIQEVLSQYQSVSTFTVRLFQEGFRLQDHYQALRRYFFMEHGDWADNFVAALCLNRWGPSGFQLQQMQVQGMLEAALQRSSCEGDEYAERLYICFSSRNSTSSVGVPSQEVLPAPVAPFVDCSRLDAFDFISLEYRVDWPLTLVLTKESFQLYNILFRFLLRMKLSVYALGDIWLRLQVFDKRLCKLSRSSHFPEQRTRFRSFLQLRHQIFHLITTVQRYVESKLLFVVWSKFLESIQLEVKDMEDLNDVHSAYLKQAINECFLSSVTQGVKGCLDTIMQCILDFLTHLRAASISYDNDELIDDHLFSKVSHVNMEFLSSLQRLNVFYLKQEPQYRTNLNDLWRVLDFNGFVTNAFSNAL